MKLIKQNYLFFMLILFLFLVDRFTKVGVLNILEDKNYLFINEYFNLNLVFNTGIGFGFLSLNDGIYYNMLSIFIFAIILVLLFFMFKSERNEKIFYSFIIGGAIGNLYDRIIFKAVPDFIDFHFKEFHWFTFNIADIFISLGIIFMILNELMYKNKKNEN
tara:strand:- start:9237 stop:9719 length:483 start_codon:yes stop_codon:yes gene_type:complete